MSDYKINQTDEKVANAKLTELGIVRFSSVPVTLKKDLLTLSDEDFMQLMAANLFNPKHTPTKQIARLNKVLRGWPNSPQTVLGRIEEMASKIQQGLKYGNKNLATSKSSEDEVARLRADWTTSRQAELRATYSLESADDVQLMALATVEFKIREISKRNEISSVAHVNRMTALVDLQNTLMKALGITRSDRKKLKDESKQKDAWESIVRSFDENKAEKYKDAEDSYKSDREQMREAEERNKQEIREMGFFGE